MTRAEIETCAVATFQNVVNELLTIPAESRGSARAGRALEKGQAMLAAEAGRLSPGVIDLAHLEQQTGGDRELEQELLALFADQCVRMLRVIREARPQDGCDAAHTLKGAARAVGAWSVAAAAEKVEQSLHRRRVAEGLGELALAADEARAAIAARAASAA